ncbi:protein Niban 2 isoform X2 [Melanerpes formicivorus]|uniref:protein Niban 2 isoform X2 n=1 Tax=Melanerpes formicivorus TaxID=211600 RepID=UPI00358E7276
MGDVVSTHLDEGRRQHIAERTGKVLGEFCRCYQEQFGVALFNSVRYEIEGSAGPQPQLLHRKVPLEDHVIYSGNIFQYIEENKKWRNRFCVVPHNYGLVLYENKLAYERDLPPRVLVNSAGYKVLTSVEQYLELVNSSLPGVTPKSGQSPILKCPTDFPLILWHPYARHYYCCVMTGKEQQRWRAVFQDCVRHCNDGISEESRVEAPAFTDAVRMYRQAKEQFGTWDMLCGNQTQVLSNLVMEELLPELRSTIGPRLKGKAQERQRTWIQISDAVYRMVYEQTKAQYEAVLAKCEQERPRMESIIRTDMDQIITSKEHLASKIRALMLPKAEVCVRNHVQPYISSILEALMTPTSQGFAEVREVFFKEVTDMNMNIVNEGGLEKLVEYMEKLSQLAFHPVKMQCCYEKMEQLKLEGLQQRFDVSSTSVFKQRAQIHMRQQMDDAVYTFETLLHQELGKLQGKEELCKSIQRILERVLKKFDYDSSTVRKKFFREALLQITIPFLLKKLAPTCKGELAKFQELIFEDFASFILVENTYEEVVLQSVMKDIMQAVKEAAVQRKHNLYRDSMVLHNSDPNLHLLAEGLPIDWAEEYSGQQEPEPGSDRRRRAKQVVSVIQTDEGVLPYEVGTQELLQPSSPRQPEAGAHPGCPDGVEKIREALAEESLGGAGEAEERLSNGTGGVRDGASTAGEVPVAPGAVPGRLPPPGAAGEQGAAAAPAAQAPPAAEVQRASPTPAADVPAGASVQHAAPAPGPTADVPAGASVQHAAPAPGPRADVPAEANAAPAPGPRADVPAEANAAPAPRPRADVPAEANAAPAPRPRADVPAEANAAPAPKPRADVPAEGNAAPAPKPRADVPAEANVQHTIPSPRPRADVPAEPQVPPATPASPTPGAEPLSPAPGPACHQPSDKETGEEVSCPSSPVQPKGTTESGEGVQTEF